MVVQPGWPKAYFLQRPGLGGLLCWLILASAAPSAPWLLPDAPFPSGVCIHWAPAEWSSRSPGTRLLCRAQHTEGWRIQKVQLENKLRCSVKLPQQECVNHCHCFPSLNVREKIHRAAPSNSVCPLGKSKNSACKSAHSNFLQILLIKKPYFIGIINWQCFNQNIFTLYLIYRGKIPFICTIAHIHIDMCI